MYKIATNPEFFVILNIVDNAQVYQICLHMNKFMKNCNINFL